MLVTLLVAVLMAYFLDPVVTWLERLRIPRALGSLIMVLLTLAVLAVMGYSLIDRADQFGADWPKYRAPSAVRRAGRGKHAWKSVEKHVSEIEPGEKPGEQVVTVGESHTVRDALVGRLNSLYEFILAATFMPFLLFFMLAAKRQVWHATMQLFAPANAPQVRDALADVTQVLRSYLMGTALVGLILIIASWLVLLGAGPRLSVPYRAGFRPLQSGSVSRRHHVVGSAAAGRTEAVPHRGAVHRHLRDADVLPHCHREPADSGAGGLARAIERAGADDLAAVLGLDVGRDGTDSGDSHHRGTQGRLRSRGELAARRPLAQRLRVCPSRKRLTFLGHFPLFSAV